MGLDGFEHALDVRNLADICLDQQRRRTALFKEESGLFGSRVVLLVVDGNFFHALFSELQRDSAANPAGCSCDQSGVLGERDGHDTLPFACTDRQD